MELWSFVQQNAIGIITSIVTAVGAYFGARSYFLAERKKQDEEISRIKQLLVGSSEVSVQNLTDVIEALRSRVDRLEQNRKEIQGLLEDERKRAERLERENQRLSKDVEEAQRRADQMEKQVESFRQQVRNAEEELRQMGAKEKTALFVTEGYDWASPPYRSDNS